MRLILRDYISTFKEEIELENLLYNILILEDFKNIIPAQKGLRQYGVDVKAEKNNEIYLFVLKQKDITRDCWNGNKTSVRQTLEDIKDVYIPCFLKDKKTVNIILCTNGVIKQEVEINWNQYIKKNKTENVEYFFWGINELSQKVEKNLLNEYIFDDEMISDLRKTIYFTSEVDNDLKYFKKVLNNIYLKIELNIKVPKKYRKNLIIYLMFVSICIKYAIDEQNNRLAIKMAERAIIKFWGFILKEKKYKKTFETDILNKLIEFYIESSRRYIKNIQKVCMFYPSFPIYNSLEYKLLVYESIGLLTTYTYFLQYYNYKGTNNEEIENNVNILINILNNNTSYLYPVYDLHSIEINGLLLLLYKIRNNDAKMVLEQLIISICDKMKISNYYPTPYEDYDMAILMEFNDEVEEFKASVLLHNLLEWMVIFNEKEQFENVVRFLERKFPKLDLSTWQIEPEEEKDMFSEARYDIGVSYSEDNNISFKKVKETMKRMKYDCDEKKLLTIKYSCEPLLLMLARNYRIPILPILWNRLLT